MSGRIRLFWLILAVLFAAAAGFACFYAGLFGSILIRPDGDPAETVSRFFTSLQNRDYETAYACLSDYATLGLEKEPETAEAKRVYDALRSSYGFTLDGESTVNGLEASQRVTLRALNLRQTENAIQQRVNGILEEKVAALPASEIYDGNGGYLTSLTDAVYADALEQALQNTDGLCTETSVEIRLKYTDGAWKMVMDRTLMNALVGGEN
ncbi:MAG: hypothetical protein IJV40_14910 [Oscillospiraceae bacterium]|nr:hypothetical protein [Oscillospiraceae bacterium]